VSLVAVIAVTATVAVSCTKNSDGNSGGGGTQTSAAPSDVASANDKGPVGIITEDPSCAPWGPIINTLSGVEGKGWLSRDPSIPLGLWTPEVRAQYEAVGTAMRKAADQAVPLLKTTTHRVMRELYGQFIAYSRAYADSILVYTPNDDNLARAGSTAGNVISDVCSAISSGAAAARASLVPALAAPASTASVGDVLNPKRMFDTPDAACSDLTTALEQLSANPAYKSWLGTDPKIPVGSWSPEQQTITDAVAPVMTATAEALEKSVQRSSNPVVQDIVQLGVQYQRTYIQALPTYQPDDQAIYTAGQRAAAVVRAACKYAAK